MAGIVIALGVTNTLLTALNNPLLKEAFLTLSYGNRLKKLKGTVMTVENLFRDAANKGDELSHTTLDYVDKLKDAVYDADDLFDELVTKAQRKQLFGGDNNIVEKVRQLLPSVKTSLRVKKLRSRLKDIADDHANFGLSIGTKPHRRLRVETFPNVYAPNVVGRDDDANKVIGMLLDSEMCTYFLAIVGIGGMGKTTLAKLVYSDKRITEEFPTRLWVCVSDQDGAVLDVKQILSRILESLECPFNDSSSVDILRREYQRNLQGKNFLLVLDDIWSEKIIELENLKELLKIDGSKTRIIATTRSKVTARIMGNAHELEGLSDEHSRSLFETVAFQDGEKRPELVEIGEKIVKKLPNLPLAIRVIGSLLYGQPIDKWQTFLTSGFNRFSEGMDDIMSILKISYDNLDPSLKSCFAYCAIFPKDYVIRKEVIISLWDAQGYIVPFETGQSIDNACEEHFAALLQRSFFQDVKINEYGDVESFKMHDLVHDLALRVSGKEICVLINSSPPVAEYKVRHIFDCTLVKEDDFIIQSKIRSYVMFQKRWLCETGNELPPFPLNKIVKKPLCLRALALQGVRVSSLPDTMGNLSHLRYLNLAKNSMKTLPDSIVNLHNLQTLNLNKCDELKGWPKEFSKLVNLRHLYREKCYELRCMPVGMSKLTRLRVLTDFVVNDESVGEMEHVGQLKDLKALSGTLKTRLSIQFHENFTSSKEYTWEGGCLEGTEHLKEVEIGFSFPSRVLNQRRLDEERSLKEEAVMTKLQPHPNLRKFMLIHYAGHEITSWGTGKTNWAEASYLPNLIHIKLSNCHRLEQLPLFSKLLHLKSLSF